MASRTPRASAPLHQVAPRRLTEPPVSTIGATGSSGSRPRTSLLTTSLISLTAAQELMLAKDQEQLRLLADLRAKDKELRDLRAQHMQEQARNKWLELILAANKNAERKRLADKAPHICDSFVDVVHQVENALLGSRGLTASKDTLGVVLVVAPPRHGKSLLLDQIFESSCDVSVCSITFNSTTHMKKTEADQPAWAIVSRMFHATYGTNDLVGVTNLLQAQFGLDGALSAFNYILAQRNVQTRFVLAIDELSNMTDLLTADECKVLVNFFNSIMTVESDDRKRAIVATGFNSQLARALNTGISGAIKCRVHIPVYEPEATRPLLIHILLHYKARNAPFPAFLWEVCKSTAGLMGELLQAAMVAQKGGHLMPSCEYFFSPDMNRLRWLWHITEVERIDDKGKLIRPLDENAKLICDYLTHVYTSYRTQERQEAEEARLRILLIDAQLALSPFQASRVHVVPMALVAVVKRTTSIDPLVGHLKGVISAGERRVLTWNPTGTITHTGVAFEEFTYHALNLRALFHDRGTLVSMQTWFRPSWSNSLSCDQPRCATEYYFSARNVTFSVHFVFGGDELRALLSPTLYYLFPIGCDDDAAKVNAAFIDGRDLFSVAQELAGTTTASQMATVTPAIVYVSASVATTPPLLQISPVAAPLDVAADPTYPTVSSNFPKLATADDIERIATWLAAAPDTTCIFKGKDDSDGCDLVLATYISDTKQLQLIFVELKDRTGLRADELQTKINVVVRATMVRNGDEDFFMPKPAMVQLRDNLEAHLGLPRDTLTMHAALVVAGRCKSTFVVNTGTIAQMISTTRKTRGPHEP